MSPVPMSLVGATTEKNQTPERNGQPLMLELLFAQSENLTAMTRPYSRSTDPVTLGITAQSSPRAPIDERVYDLDVGSGLPIGAAAIKGSFVQRLKSYVI